MDIQKVQDNALVPIGANQDENFDLLVVFRLLDQEYGLMASGVREIIRNRATTRVPNSSEYIDGVINLRGRIIPVFNIRRRLQMAEAEAEMQADLTVMVIESEGNDAGLLVDRVTDVVKIDESQVDQTVSYIKGLAGKQYIQGTVDLGGRLVTMLKLEPLLSSDS